MTTGLRNCLSLVVFLIIWGMGLQGVVACFANRKNRWIRFPYAPLIWPIRLEDEVTGISLPRRGFESRIGRYGNIRNTTKQGLMEPGTPFVPHADVV